MNISKVLVARRVSLGISVASISQAARVPINTYLDIESQCDYAEIAMSLDEIFRICFVMKLDFLQSDVEDDRRHIIASEVSNLQDLSGNESAILELDLQCSYSVADGLRNPPIALRDWNLDTVYELARLLGRRPELLTASYFWHWLNQQHLSFDPSSGDNSDSTET